MSEIVEHPRSLCALGAQQSVAAIERAIPILHAGPGCGYKLHLGLGYFNGFQGGGYSGGSAIVCTNMGEKEVVFGGEDRLRSVIDGALKVMDGDFFVVLSGCTTELIGDDIGSVVRSYRNDGIPIVYAATPGFKGSNLAGHELVVSAIIDQILEPAKQVVPGLVNVWSSVPYHDPFWAGNLLEIRRLLKGIGLEANVLFGPDSGGIDAWKRVPSAQLNIVLASWTGVGTARKLGERFGAPWFHQRTLPIGSRETSIFLKKIAELTGRDDRQTAEFIGREEKIFHYYHERSADFFLELRWDLPDRFSVIADSYYVGGIARLLVNEYALIPAKQYITDNPPEEFRPRIMADLQEIAPGISAEAVFSSDGLAIREGLVSDGPTPPIILGSSWDREIAREIGACYCGIAAPLTDRIISNTSYFGYQGGLRLIEDLYSSILNSIQ